MNRIPFDSEPFQKHLRRDDLGNFFDPVRQKWVKGNPEELVRQLMLAFLIHSLNISRGRIAVEKQILFNQLKKRFDIVVYNRPANPELLIECKSYKLPLHQSMFDQAAVYNFSLKAPILCIFNGIEMLAAKIDFVDQRYEWLDELKI